MSKEWDQLQDESNKVYSYFEKYRDMGVRRTIEKVKQKYPDETPVLERLYNYSSQYNWVDRVKAWDNYLSEKRIQDIENKFKERTELEIDKLFSRSDLIDENLDNIVSNVGTKDTSKAHAIERNTRAKKETLAMIYTIAGKPTEYVKSEVKQEVKQEINNRESVFDTVRRLKQELKDSNNTDSYQSDDTGFEKNNIKSNTVKKKLEDFKNAGTYQADKHESDIEFKLRSGII